MIHPDTELLFVNDVIGYGVFAKRPIPRGTITWVRDEFDQSFSSEQIARLSEPHLKVLRKYGYLDRHGRTVLCWDHARFMNHSCEANCLGAGYDFEIAVRDIRAGEELTGEVRPDDMIRLADRWDELLRGSFPLLQQVPQPLWPLVVEKDDVLHASSNADLMRSCRFHHLREQIPVLALAGAAV
jgi:uncharacterized protein